MAGVQMLMYGPAAGGTGAGVPGAEVLAGQIMQLTETIATMEDEMNNMNAEINCLQRRGRDGGYQVPERTNDNDFVDKKFFTPELFTSTCIFREWNSARMIPIPAKRTNWESD